MSLTGLKNRDSGIPVTNVTKSSTKRLSVGIMELRGSLDQDSLIQKPYWGPSILYAV